MLFGRRSLSGIHILFLQGMYLNFGGFSTFSSEPAGCLDAFFSLICSLQWHSTLLISGNSFLCAFWRISCVHQSLVNQLVSHFYSPEAVNFVYQQVKWTLQHLSCVILFALTLVVFSVSTVTTTAHCKRVKVKLARLYPQIQVCTLCTL